MSPFQLINAFRAELDAAVKETIQLATKSPREGGDEWNKYMESNGETPKTGDERKQLLSLKEETSKGALPIEVRMILEKHKIKASEKLQDWKREFGQEEWWARVEGPAKKVMEDFIQDAIKKYIGETTPKSVTAKTIFSNSSLTTPKYYTQVYEAGTKSEKCPTCMAARPADTELNTCAFCGSPIFNF